MKQFYINQKGFQDSVLKSLEDQKVASAVGILLGKREGEKLNIYDVMLIPDPEET